MKTLALLLPGILILFPAFAFALEEFTHPRHQFSLTVPEAFHAERDPHPNVGVLLSHRESKYPTFNIVTVPGKYDGTRSKKEQTRRLLEQYGLVGITEAEALGSEMTMVAGSPAFSVKIKYTIGSETLISSATIVSAGDRHFILTYVDRAGVFEKRISNRSDIQSSFHPLNPIEEASRSTAGERKIPLSLIIMLITIALMALFFYRRSRRS